MNPVLSDFLSQEASPQVCRMIREAFVDNDARPEIEKKTFEFNCYDVILDFEKQVAVVDSVLTNSPNETATIDISEFRQIIEDHNK